MAPLILALGAALSVPAPSSDIERWAPLIDGASVRFAVPAAWIRQVMRAESGGRTMRNGRPIRSRTGAIGLMQLMPGTWSDMRTAYRLGANPDDPADNILAGTAYLRLLYDRFGYPGLFGAYNAGPTRYAAVLQGRASLPLETQFYLASVTRASGEAQSEAKPTTLFAVRHDRDEMLLTPADRPERSLLFVPVETSR
jgi:soluble lytic murein transglycosylase-like protein